MTDALPENVQLLQNKKLANAFQHKLDVPCQEWDSFTLADLRKDHFVQVGKAYYQSVFGVFRQLATDHCINVYAGGEKIILAHYVDAINCATNAP